MDLLAEPLQRKGLVEPGEFVRAYHVRARTGDRLAVTLPRLGLVSEDLSRIYVETMSLYGANRGGAA